MCLALFSSTLAVPWLHSFQVGAKRKGSERKGVHWWKNFLFFPLSCKNLAAAVAAAVTGGVFHSAEHTGNL